ncbi:MAG: galactose oxidase [Sphingobacteriaceae bacterium]|nr:MAG: galactose oxidase [Sphingobacteriaceae bacterium]
MREYFTALKSIVVFLFLLVLAETTFAQNYGLRFLSHERHQDERTSLNLTPEKELCFNSNFDLAFDISFAANHSVYFGYIVRIIENGSRNIDLVYNTSKDHFNVIIGDSLSKINFNISRDLLYNRWNNIRIRFDVINGELSVLHSGKTYKQKVALKKGSCYRMVFGANKSEPFETTDIPPMKVRHVKIFQNQELKYHWPLNECSGTIAHEEVQNQKATVANALWQTALHAKWSKLPGINVNGIASVSFNAAKELIYVAAQDTVYTYSVNNGTWAKTYTNGQLVLNQGNRLFYNQLDNSLYNVFPGRETVAKFDFNKHGWSGNFPENDVTGFWHYNKMLSVADTSMYLFGGYGYLLYKNNVQRYSFNTKKWSDVKFTGDFFTPRYLAALGSTLKGDTAYILGGYGNTSGDQVRNPKNLYDMMRFTVKDRTFKKLFELQAPSIDFTFANSLVIDEKTQKYYGLIFPRNKYNSSLQLVRGSLISNSLQKLGNAIPYSFHDVHSFADLYYCADSKKFITVILLRTDDNHTRVSIYSLLDPPYVMPQQVQAGTGNKFVYYAIAVFVLLAGLALALFYRKRKKQRVKEHAVSPKPVLVVNTANDEVQLTEMELAGQNEVKAENTTQFKNAILLFGDLQVFDTEGHNITKNFTPLIKELFLLILIYTVKLGRGVSSDKLNEIFWFDKSEKSARNNRSVAIVKLKSLLEKLDYCSLSKESGYWTIEIDYQHFYVDYHSYLNIVNRKKQDDEEIQHLSRIVQRGSFLSTSEYEWLDIFKSEISNDIINIYLRFLQSPEHHNDPEFLIKIANYILNIDPVNEEAMILKCRSFVELGKHSLAKATFETFVKAYKNMYNQSFNREFNSILEKVV